jgi:PAS domain S-box-containing protein
MEQFPVGKRYPYFIAGILVFLALYLTSLYNYLLFHSLAEIFSIVVACGIFMVTWNSRHFLDNNYLLFLGVAYLFVGGLDLIHTLTYKGMGIFQGYGSNLATQLWIAARYTESLSFLIAPLFVRRKLKINLLFSSYILALLLSLISIFYWNIFPLCFVEGVGLTPFKKISEYIISVILLASIALLLKNRSEFDRDVLRWVVWSIILTIASELAFTFYIEAYGFSNLLGHFFKIASFYFIYKALIEMGLTRPYDVLFRNLKRSESMVQKEKSKIQNYLDIVGVILIVIDAYQTVRLINKKGCEILGYEEKEVIGKNWFDTFIPGGIREEVRMTFKSLMKGATNPLEYFENPVLTKTGEERMVAWHNAVLQDEKGNGINTLSSGEDITDRKKIEEELRRSRDELEFRVRERTTELANAYRELKEQSRILESFFQYTVTPLVFLDRDFNFIRVNEAYARACQREASEFPGHNHFEFYPSDAKAKFEQVVQTKEPYMAIARPFTFPDHPEWGTTYWDWILTPLLDDAGEVEFLVLSLEDVTERKRAQEAEKAERQRFNDVLEMLPAYLVLLTPDYHVSFANRIFRERFGESHGRRCFEYLFGRSEPCETCETYTVLKTNAPHHWEWTGPDDRTYDVFDFPFIDTDGSTFILEMGIDITERKRAEQALREASLYNRSLIEASLDPLITIDKQGKVTDVNSATELATGIAREQLVGSDFSDYFTDPNKARQGYLKVFSRGTIRDYPLAIRHRSGIITDVLYNATLYRNETGEIQGIVAAARDITERKRAEEALRESENRLRVLSSQLLTAQESERRRIAMELHDGIGQMLTAIKFKVESTLGGKSRARGKEKSLEAIIPMVRESVEEVRRMQMDLRPSTLDDLGILATLRWFCREYQKIYSHIHVEKEIGLEESDVSTLLRTVIYRLTQEAMNNIAKHSQADLIYLSLRRMENKIELFIRDNGVGFNLEEVLSSVRSKRGLGLDSMRERTELSGGTFIIESTPGKGTTVRASWPL